jgi:predicted nucleic acid-binding protein
LAFTAMLDTCVLVPSLQRDVLLECAAAGVYRPLWSAAILAELDDVLTRLLSARGRPDSEVTAYRRRLRSQMAAAFPDALVTGWEPLEPTIDTPDPGDAHVVAAALTGGAHVIVTDDQHGFTRPLPGDLTVETTDEFLLGALDSRPAAVVQAVEAVAARTGRHGPVRTALEIAGLLRERNTLQFGTAVAALLANGP